MRILLIRLSALGDILRVLPAWVNLRAVFPDAQFQAMIEVRHAFLLEPIPWLTPVLVDRNHLKYPLSFYSEMKRIVRLINSNNVSLDFHGILKSSFAPWLANIPERWGDGITKECAHLLQTNRLEYKLMTRYDQALRLAKEFSLSQNRDCDEVGIFNPIFRDLRLSKYQPLLWDNNRLKRIILVPGTSLYGAIKRWSVDNWIILARILKGKYQLYWSLGPDEDYLRFFLPNETGVEALPRMGFWELASVIQKADVVISSDTGLLHLSILLGVYVIGLYGSSNIVISGIPHGSGHIVHSSIVCSPCRERLCQRCDCMSRLTIDMVLDAVNKYMVVHA